MKVNFGVVKLITLVILIITILITFFRAIFYSDYTANLSLIIPTRIWYQNTYWQAEGLFIKPVRTYPPFDPIYTISVDRSDVKGTYKYSLWGTVSLVDTNNKTIYVLGSDGREYVFTLNSYGFSFTGSVSKDFGQEGIAAFKGAKVLLSWQDTKSLNAIKKAYGQNRIAPINQGAIQGSLILKFINNLKE